MARLRIRRKHAIREFESAGHIDEGYSSLKKRIILLLKFMAAVLFGIALMEGTLRLIGMGPPPAPSVRVEMVDVDDLPIEKLPTHAYRNGWINEPNSSKEIDFHGESDNISLQRNWLGIREDDQTTVEPAPNQTRIIVLGDSHSDGFVPNASSYANILERKLGTEFDVVNCSQGASSPYDQLWAYKKVFQRLKPEIVIVGFYAGNDYIDLMNQHHSSYLAWNGKEFVRAPKTGRPDLSLEHPQPSLWDHLCRISAIFHSMRTAGLLPPKKDAISSRRSGQYFDLLVKAREVNPAAVWQGLNQAFFFSQCPDEWEMAHRKFEFVVDEFKRTVPPNRLLFLIIPTYRQIKPDTVNDAAQVLKLSQLDLNTDKRVCDDARQILTDAQIPFIDLRSVMKESKEKLYWDFDHHINDNAHRLIAEQLEKRWKKLFLEVANGK